MCFKISLPTPLKYEPKKSPKGGIMKIVAKFVYTGNARVMSIIAIQKNGEPGRYNQLKTITQNIEGATKLLLRLSRIFQ